MPAHNPETDSRTRTEHSDNNTPGCLKQLKSVALGLQAGTPARSYHWS
jgi:hypothetical protein